MNRYVASADVLGIDITLFDDLVALAVVNVDFDATQRHLSPTGVSIPQSSRATASDYERISRTGDISSLWASFSLFRCTYRSDINFHMLHGNQP